MGRIIKNILILGISGVVVPPFALALLNFTSPRGALIFSVVSSGLGVLLFFGLLQPRLPVLKRTGILLVWTGVLAGYNARQGFELVELREKIPVAESMSLRERTDLFERLTELEPRNKQYRERRDELSASLKKQEAEERAEKERVRLAIEAEQRTKAWEEECAKLSRDPDAWAKAVANGTLSSLRGQARLYVEKQLSCYPEDKALAKQLAYMRSEEERVRREEDAFRNPQSYLKLSTSWRTTDVGGGIMKADFRIQNTSPLPIKDIAIVCNMKAPSGTIVSVNRQTIYDVVKGGATRSFKDINMGFINAQASTASCRVEAAQAY